MVQLYLLGISQDTNIESESSQASAASFEVKFEVHEIAKVDKKPT